MTRLMMLAALLVVAAAAGIGKMSADERPCGRDDRPSWISLVNDTVADEWRFEWGEWPAEVAEYRINIWYSFGGGTYGRVVEDRRFEVRREDIWSITSFYAYAMNAGGAGCGGISWTAPSRRGMAQDHPVVWDQIIDAYKARIDDLQANGGRLGRSIQERDQRIRELEGELAAVPGSVAARVSVLGGRIWLHHREGRRWRLSGSFEWADCTIIDEPRVVCLTAEVPTGKPGG